MTKPNLQFGLGALLILAGAWISVHGLSAELEVRTPREPAAIAAPAQPEPASARGDAAALGRLAALTGIGVIALGWFNLKRELEAAAVGS